MNIKISSIEEIIILTLSGKFDASSASFANQRIDEVSASAPARLVVNLKAVQFIDSTALAILVRGLKRSRLLNGDLRLCNVPSTIRMIFELTNLDKVFEIFLDEEDAIKSFEKIT